ncbi:MAG: hypothetical protein AAGA55_06175 [Planctomycetota bacterium]
MAKRGKKTSKRSSKKKAVRKTRSKTGGPKSLAGLSVSELQAELRRRQRGVARLERRRDKLMSELAEVNAQISDLGGASGLTASGRARNAMTLPDALAEVLSGVEMSVTEASEAVRAAGYQSSAANFRTMVNQALLRDERFSKVSRGRYTAV